MFLELKENERLITETFFKTISITVRIMQKRGILERIRNYLLEKDSLTATFLVIIVAVLFGMIFGLNVWYFLGFNDSHMALKVTRMEHSEPFDKWFDSQKQIYENYGITKKEFSGFAFANGINENASVVIKGTDANKIKIGDVILYPEWGVFFGRVLQIENNNDGYLIHIKPDRTIQVFILKFDKESKIEKMVFVDFLRPKSGAN